MFPCRPLVSPLLPRALAAGAPFSVRRLPWPSTSHCVVRCMAKVWRVQMVAKRIQRSRHPRGPVIPATALGADPYLSSLTTIADVELSNDLQSVSAGLQGVCVRVRGRDGKEGCHGRAQGQDQVRQEPDWQVDEAAPHARDTVHRRRVHGARKQEWNKEKDVPVPPAGVPAAGIRCIAARHPRGKPNGYRTPAMDEQQQPDGCGFACCMTWVLEKKCPCTSSTLALFLRSIFQFLFPCSPPDVIFWTDCSFLFYWFLNSQF